MGIRLLEMRYAPSFVSMRHDHDFKDVLVAIERGVQRAQEKYDVAVGLICIAVGAMGHSEVEKTVDFLLANQSSFVGFDMAGAETELKQWEPHFKRVQEAGINITCHASEDLHDGVPENALTAVDILGASRVGHGIQIIQNKTIME